ncbi:MAG: hypothetical protein BWY83_02398 [bacterium ADurb.Bin478]|nr:MAG: hypothetical protein BWY83_02398 [bacterium ADurb.Bin478]
MTLLLLGASLSLGQEPKPEPAKPDSVAVGAGQTSAPVVDENNKVFLDKIEIEGRLEKPQAVFIIPGSNPEIDDINIERAFFNEIFRPVERKGRVTARPTAPGQERKDVIPW